MFSKICILIACVGAVLAESSLQNNFLEVVRQCAVENGVYELFSADIRESENCILSCSMKKLGTFEDGRYNAEKVVELLPKDYPRYGDVVSVVKTCGAEYGVDDCDTAGLVRACLRKNLPCDDDYQCHLQAFVLSIYNSQMA